MVATVPLGTVVTVQNLGKKKWLTKPKHCSYSDLAHSRLYIYIYIYIDLFSFVVGHSFIFNYFILTYKKLMSQ